MRWLCKKTPPPSPRHPDDGIELFTVVFLAFTLEPDHHVADISFTTGDITVDAAAELASMCYGGPYVSVIPAAWCHSWLIGNFAMMSHRVAVEALILDEAYDAMDELKKMARDGRWQPAGVPEAFRLQHGELLPMIE